VSRSGSASSRFSTKATKQGALNSHPGFVQEGDPAGWNKPRHEHATPCSIKQRAGAMPPQVTALTRGTSNRPVSSFKNQIEGRLT
jgi:hypothetical protein